MHRKITNSQIADLIRRKTMMTALQGKHMLEFESSGSTGNRAPELKTVKNHMSEMKNDGDLEKFAREFDDLGRQVLYRFNCKGADALCANISETPAPNSLVSKRAVRRITDGGDTRDGGAGVRRVPIPGTGSP